ncbi:MAG: AAA family ATPase [Acidobacteriota bacterium]
MYVTSLKIENLRCFKDTALQFQYPGNLKAAAPDLQNINLLLGMNGAGKTTTLKAIALATLAPVITQSGYVPYRLVRRTGSKATQIQEARVTAEVLLHSQDVNADGTAKRGVTRVEHMTTRILRIGETERLESESAMSAGQQKGAVWHNMFYENNPAFLVVGYGATRRVEDTGRFDASARAKSRLLRYQRVAGLFESDVPLTPLPVWLPEFKTKNPGRYKQVVNLINRLLPDEAKFSGVFENGEYHFEFERIKIPFGALSDGYRAYIGWIADLLYHICMGAPSGAKLVDNYGVVLVDEIDLHLHPEWQRSVISRVSKALPNLQFVFSTHSPIVAGSLHKENIFVMETDTTGASQVHKYDERIYGLDAEQVLLSSYFNLTTTRAPGFVDELQSLSKQATEKDPRAALEIMRKLAGQNEVVRADNSQAHGLVEKVNRKRSVDNRRSRKKISAKVKGTTKKKL